MIGPWFHRETDGRLLVAVQVEKVGRRTQRPFVATRWLPAPLPPAPFRSPPTEPVNVKRITLALNFRGFDGPEVDEALGVAEPTVDWWEMGALVPSLEDVQRLATLTGYSVEFFYRDDPPEIESGFMCGRAGCQMLGSSV